MIDLATIATVAKDIKSTKDAPQTFNEAWNHPNLKSLRKLQEAIKKKFSHMKKQQICRKSQKNLMPPNCRCVEVNVFSKLRITVCTGHVW